MTRFARYSSVANRTLVQWSYMPWKGTSSQREEPIPGTNSPAEILLTKTERMTKMTVKAETKLGRDGNNSERGRQSYTHCQGAQKNDSDNLRVDLELRILRTARVVVGLFYLHKSHEQLGRAAAISIRDFTIPGNKQFDRLEGEASNVRRVQRNKEWSYDTHRTVLRSVMTLVGGIERLFLLVDDGPSLRATDVARRAKPGSHPDAA